MRMLMVITGGEDAADGGPPAPEHELAMLSVPDGAPPNGFIGLDSLADATVVVVCDVDVAVDVVVAAVVDALARRHPWGEDALADAAARLTAGTLRLAGQFPVGTVLAADDDGLTAHIPVPGPARGPLGLRSSVPCGRRGARPAAD